MFRPALLPRVIRPLVFEALRLLEQTIYSFYNILQALAMIFTFFLIASPFSSSVENSLAWATSSVIFMVLLPIHVFLNRSRSKQLNRMHNLFQICQVEDVEFATQLTIEIAHDLAYADLGRTAAASTLQNKSQSSARTASSIVSQVEHTGYGSAILHHLEVFNESSPVNHDSFSGNRSTKSLGGHHSFHHPQNIPPSSTLTSLESGGWGSTFQSTPNSPRVSNASQETGPESSGGTVSKVKQLWRWLSDKIGDIVESTADAMIWIRRLFRRFLRESKLVSYAEPHDSDVSPASQWTELTISQAQHNRVRRSNSAWSDDVSSGSSSSGTSNTGKTKGGNDFTRSLPKLSKANMDRGEKNKKQEVGYWAKVDHATKMSTLQGYGDFGFRTPEMYTQNQQDEEHIRHEVKGSWSDFFNYVITSDSEESESTASAQLEVGESVGLPMSQTVEGRPAAPSSAAFVEEEELGEDVFTDGLCSVVEVLRRGEEVGVWTIKRIMEKNALFAFFSCVRVVLRTIILMSAVGPMVVMAMGFGLLGCGVRSGIGFVVGGGVFASCGPWWTTENRANILGCLDVADAQYLGVGGDGYNGAGIKVADGDCAV